MKIFNREHTSSHSTLKSTESGRIYIHYPSFLKKNHYFHSTGLTTMTMVHSKGTSIHTHTEPDVLRERKRLLGDAEEKAEQKEVKKPITELPRPSAAFFTYLFIFLQFFTSCRFSLPHHTDEAVNEYRLRYHYSLVWLELIEAFIKATGIDTFTNNAALAYRTDGKYSQCSGRALQISFFIKHSRDVTKIPGDLPQLRRQRRKI